MKVEYKCKNMTGYNIHFLGENDVVEMPDYKECIDDIAINNETSKYELDYINYSVI